VADAAVVAQSSDDRREAMGLAAYVVPRADAELSPG
jgi:hypothetical protein